MTFRIFWYRSQKFQNRLTKTRRLKAKSRNFKVRGTHPCILLYWWYLSGWWWFNSLSAVVTRADQCGHKKSEKSKLSWHVWLRSLHIIRLKKRLMYLVIWKWKSLDVCYFLTPYYFCHNTQWAKIISFKEIHCTNLFKNSVIRFSLNTEN